MEKGGDKMATSIGTLFRIEDLESASDLLRKDVSALSDRVKQLENHIRETDQYIRRLESLLAQHGISFPAEEETAPAEPKPVGEPVTFSTRTEETIACPRCGRKQKGNRSACYSCGTPFLYENE